MNELTAPPARVDVLVAGGGPVGSALALELARRGVRPLIVERRRAIQTANVRARNISIRTLELCRRWGVAGAFRSAQTLPQSWHRGTVVATRVAGAELCPPLGAGRPTWSPAAPWWELASEPPQDLPQYHVNRILRERALELGARIALGWEVAEVSQDADSATVEVVGPDGERRSVEAAWVVGADGGRSAVRRSAGIEMVADEPLGRYHNFVFRLPGGFAALGVEPAVLFMVFNADVHGLISPFEPELWRVGIGPTPVEVTLEAAQLLDAARRYLGVGPEIVLEAVSVSTHLVQKRVAETLRKGRILLVGDAVQAFPPHLGQNLNSGIAAAATLGWALAAVVQGWGGDTLLDAYAHERAAVAHRLADATMASAAGMAELRARLEALTALEQDGPEGEAQRAELGAELAAILSAGSDGIVFDHRFPDSPIVVAQEDGPPAPPFDPERVTPSSAPGHRAPHLWLADGTPLSDRFGDWFTLLDLGADPADVAAVATAAEAAGLPLEVVALDEPAARAAYELPLVLVRPDHVVAWRGTGAPSDPLALIDAIRGRRVRAEAAA
ncbi:FAD-dependent monooxygenase [Conexibacter arvalis]|uniref:2-polyprenyl-6-methoxyphenol hydroxylase-like FAD-dependent oxidoreductase n=1 Tax=Conexibacter arvalis TaxID=912552 RepID=A0A840IB89_9ACTN|nr:FAD-dependent monooxygenase [Conexibacter arvalis]MBB4662187.1 2-polyprenyl-6-methoxyphenol hydroxylase-like FAD-dependent oxidoreductase [Conexibacter arvalis]